MVKISGLIQKSIYNELLSSKDSETDIEEFYSHLKEILQYNPKLKSKVDDIYSKELKKVKKEAARQA